MPEIEGAFFATFKFSINFERAEQPLPPECLQHGVTVFRQGNDRMVAVRIQVESSKQQQSPIEIEAEAIVTLEKFESDITDEEKDRHAVMLAAPIAYGMVREQISAFTARSPFPVINLPMISSRALISNASLITDSGEEIVLA